MPDEELARLIEQLEASRAAIASLERRLAAAAHEINNPLAVLQIGLEQLAMQLARQPQLRVDAFVLIEHCERIARVVERLTATARPRAERARTELDAGREPRGEAPDAGSQGVTAALPSRPPSLRVLCVEDEPVLRNLLGTMLADLGHAPTVVRSAEAALEVLAEATFDAVLTDVQLPGESGHGLRRAIAASYPALTERVILMSGHFQTIPTGQPCLQKPFGFEELGDALAAIAMA